MRESLESIKHPPQQDHAQQMSPHAMWSSTAMVFAALASLVTRRPLLTAMASATSALQAYQTGNQEAVNAAFSKWKLDTENFYKVANAQQDIYRNLMEDARQRLSESDRVYDREIKSTESTLRARAAALQDEQIANADNMRMMVQVYDARQTGLRSMQTNSTKTEESLLLDQSWKEKQGTAEYKNGTSGQRLKMYAELVHELAPSQSNLDPLKNATEKAKLVKAFTDSVPGKANNIAQDANHTIQQLVRQPDILNNPSAQLTVVDKFVYLATGSIRPTLAQYQKILGAATARDYMDMVAGRIPHHPILGRDQITNMARTAQVDANSAQQSYDAFLLRPENVDLVTELGMLPKTTGPSGDGGPAKAPVKGEVDYDYEFQGGDPSDHKNWKKVDYEFQGGDPSDHKNWKKVG
jgi:hypothetical protein